MYRKGQKREEAMPGTGSLHLRSSGNKHVSLTYIYLYVLHLEVYKYLHSAHTCIHCCGLPMLTYTFATVLHSDVCAITFVHQYQYTDGLNLCTMHTTQSHHQGPHRYSQPQCHTGRYTYSHRCILTLSYTQSTDPSLTLMYTFSQI